jgi:hypothetical protein
LILLYVDESGKLATKGEYFVLGGVAVHESDLDPLRRRIEGVVRRHLLEHQRGLELHAQSIRAGSGPWGRIPKEAKQGLLRDIPRLLGSFTSGADHPYALFGVARAPGAVPLADPMERCFEELFLRFTEMMVRHSRTGEESVGIVVADEAKYEKLLQPIVNVWREVGTRGGRLQRLRRLVEVPLFVDSKATRLIQMADFVAHAVYRNYTASDDTLLTSMVPAFDTEHDIIHGLVHLVRFHGACPCRACVSRATAAATRNQGRYVPLSTNTGSSRLKTEQRVD